MTDCDQDYNDGYEEFKKYRDQFGLNQIDRDPNGNANVSQNGALFTCEYLVCFHSSFSEHPKFQEELERVRAAINQLEIMPGLSVRFPGSIEGDSMDNMGAIAIFSRLFDDGGLARRIYEYGKSVKCVGPYTDYDEETNKKFYKIAKALSFFREPKNFWNNQKPNEFNLSGWFGRSPGFMALIKYCATGKMNAWNAFSLLVGQFICFFKDPSDTDIRKLPYINWQLLKNRNWFWKLMYKLWCRRLMKDYKRGMQDVYQIYYRSETHPLVVYSKSYIK